MPDQSAAPAQPAAAPAPAPAPDAAAAPAAQPKQGLWHRVLEGALAGLQTHTGMVQGALDPKTAIATKQNMQQMQAAKVRFESAQAASLVAQEHARQVQLAQQDKQLQIQSGELDEKLMKDFMDHGAVPVATTHDDSDAAHTAALNQVSDAHQNGIPGLMTFKLPSGQTVAFRMSDVAGNQGAVHMLNLYQVVNGQTPTDSATLNNKSLTTPAARDRMFDKAKAFMNPVPTSEADLTQKRQAYQNYLANAQSLPNSNPLKAESVAAMQKAVNMLNQPWKFAPPLKAVAGTVNGQPAFGILTQQGWVDPDSHQPIPGFQPPKNYAQVATDVANLRNETQTKEVLRPDGVHIMAYDPATKNFTRDQGLAGTGAQGNRASAASSSKRMGDTLIQHIYANSAKLGTLGAWVQKYGLNTPVADPDLAQLQGELSSFAALQPVQHGFRSTDALHTFETIIGGLQKNPAAMIRTIRALNETAAAINPTIKNGGSAAPKAAPAAAPKQTPPAGGKAAQFGQSF